MDQRSHTLKTVAEDGRIACFAGRERDDPGLWAKFMETGALTGAIEFKGRR